MLPPLSIRALRGCEVSSGKKGRFEERVVYGRIDVNGEERCRDNIENWFPEDGRKTYARRGFCGERNILVGWYGRFEA